jgi:hypothetical protein
MCIATRRRDSQGGKPHLLYNNFRRRLRESGVRSKRPVVGPIIKQRHKTARLTWARARRRWRIHT